MMKLIILLSSFFAIIQANSSLNIEGMNVFPVENANSFFDFFKGFGAGFVQAIDEDIDSLPQCALGFPCAIEEIREFVEYVKNMEEFDLVEFFKKLYDIVILGVSHCIESCVIPATYVAHFWPLIEGFTLESLKKILLRGLLLNAWTIIETSQDAIRTFINGDYYGCGICIGYITWCAVTR